MQADSPNFLQGPGPSYAAQPPGHGPADPYRPPPAAPWPPAQPYPPVTVIAQAPGATGTVLAAAALFVGVLALLGVGVLALVGGVMFGGDLEDGGGGWGPTRGTLAPPAGGPLEGKTLAEEVGRQVRNEGGDPEDITCPGTSRVQQDVTTVCHGQIDGDDYAFVVFFEDERGAYTLLEI